MLEGGEPDAVQVETPDDHLGVVSEKEDGRDEGEEDERMDRSGWQNPSIGEIVYKYGRMVEVIMSATGVALLTQARPRGKRWQRSW